MAINPRAVAMQGLGFLPRLVAMQGLYPTGAAVLPPLVDHGVFGGAPGHKKRPRPKRRKDTELFELEFLLLE